MAIYKLAKLPATNLKLEKRGELKVGNYADIVIFDPEKVEDHATFDKPHQYSTGVIAGVCKWCPGDSQWRTYGQDPGKVCERTRME